MGRADTDLRNLQVIPGVAAEAHPIAPAWSALYGAYKCKACGRWVHQIHGGEWEHGGINDGAGRRFGAIAKGNK